VSPAGIRRAVRAAAVVFAVAGFHGVALSRRWEHHAGRVKAAALLLVAFSLAGCKHKPLELELLPTPELSGWRRVELSPLAKKPVWTVTDDGKTLLVDGAGAKEMLLLERELGDGVLHVEWRFRKSSEQKPTYNGGVYVRTSLDGKAYVQAQVAHLEKPPVVGDIIAQVPGRTERVNVYQKDQSPEKPVGEWNAYDITMRGKSIELSVNGKQTVTWPDCPMLRGHVGLQAEGSFFEVRSIKFRAL
jgi:hypothetical protein